jgi:hypothetical protein
MVLRGFVESWIVVEFDSRISRLGVVGAGVLARAQLMTQKIVPSGDRRTVKSAFGG